MIQDTLLYSKRTKVAELIATDNDLLSILQRLGIRLGFGEITVEEMCQKYNLSTELFLIICNIYSVRDYVPHIDFLQQSDILHITNYLRASHFYYKEVCFPQLHEKIHKLVKELDAVNRKLIDKFYDDYDSEIDNHFYFEENIVFPYIDSLSAPNNNNSSDFRISKFEEKHSNIVEKLNDLKNIIIKYLPEEYSSPLRFEILKDIYDIEKDLQKHSLIENNLLVSLVQKIEKQI
jgi:regulator of cell morphogenesis and NO signaling